VPGDGLAVKAATVDAEILLPKASDRYFRGNLFASFQVH